MGDCAMPAAEAPSSGSRTAAPGSKTFARRQREPILPAAAAPRGVAAVVLAAPVAPADLAAGEAAEEPGPLTTKEGFAAAFGAFCIANKHVVKASRLRW